MEYKLVGKDLPELYKDQQDPLFHANECFDLAEGKGWCAKIETCGEVRAYNEAGERVSIEDLIAKYDTDSKLAEAEDSGKFSLGMNNWYEVEFFVGDGKKWEYLDILADDCVCWDFTEAIHIFNDYMKDEAFLGTLKQAIKEKDLTNKLTCATIKE